MSEEEHKTLVGRKRSERPNSEMTPLQKMNRKLNIAIAIVSLLILFVTITILNNRPEETSSKASTEEQTEQIELTEKTEPQTNEQEDSVAPEPTEETVDGENTISESADANVIEVWTNEAWTPYPTKQTGSHASVFESGHIDYEEKLAAAFSVLPIDQENSIVTSARNNGDAQSARIVMTNKEKTENYRVIIQWKDGEGWLPTSVDVLYNVDGVR